MVNTETERAATDLSEGIRLFVGRRVRQPADVDDIVQHVFLQLHRSAPAFRHDSALHAWLYRTARHAIADYYRSPARRREVAGDDALAAAERGGTPEAVGDTSALAELARCLDPLLAKLAATDREALRLVDMDEVTHSDAATRLGLSVSGMKSRVQRARARLRDLVETCCRVELDRRGGLVDYERRRDGACGCGVCGEGLACSHTPDGAHGLSARADAARG